MDSWKCGKCGLMRYPSEHTWACTKGGFCRHELAAPDLESIITENLDPERLLQNAAELFRTRNATYGSNYKNMGTILYAFFPDGIGCPADEKDWNRLNLFIDCVGKLSRYARNMEQGGHRDSVRDLIVYAAMLEEATEEKPELEGDL